MSKKKRYRVTAEITISVSTLVEASSPEEAKEEALERPIVGLCHQCASGDTDEQEWVTSGELDGEPNNLNVESA